MWLTEVWWLNEIWWLKQRCGGSNKNVAQTGNVRTPSFEQWKALRTGRISKKNISPRKKKILDNIPGWVSGHSLTPYTYLHLYWLICLHAFQLHSHLVNMQLLTCTLSHCPKNILNRLSRFM